MRKMRVFFAWRFWGKRGSGGFTLVEIMVVVAVIGLLTAIAIPNLLRMRISANEGTIKEDLRGFSTANEIFRSSTNPLRYANTVNELAGAVPSYIDATWLASPRHQYLFNYAIGAQGSTYSMLAAPTPNGGINTFCVDQSGVLSASVEGQNPPAGNGTGCAGGTPLQG